jgi:hypothetical protein
MARGKVEELHLIFHHHRMTEGLDEEFDFVSELVKRMTLAWCWHAVPLLKRNTQPSPLGRGCPAPALSQAGAGRVRGYFPLQTLLCG